MGIAAGSFGSLLGTRMGELDELVYLDQFWLICCWIPGGALNPCLLCARQAEPNGYFVGCLLKFAC